MNGTLTKQYFKKHIAKIMSLLDISGAHPNLKKEIKSEIWHIHTDTETELLQNGAFENGERKR